MAAFTLVDVYLNITGPGDISAYLQQLNVTHSQAEVEASGMTTSGAQPFRERLVGLQDYAMSVVIKDDLADNGIDEDFFALWGTTFAVAWRYHNTDISDTNPEYQTTMTLTMEAVGGNVGDLAKRSFNMVIASGVVTRDVAP